MQQPYHTTDGSRRHIKGDPTLKAIAHLQDRACTAIDHEIDDLFDLLETLFIERGMHHAIIGFSNNRLTAWHYNDPHRYYIHMLDEMEDRKKLLDYFPPVTYPEVEAMSRETLRAVFKRFKDLREFDSTYFLRNASVNLINRRVGLTFSCDGQHYLDIDDFVQNGVL